jgi:hypothetical protein
MTFWFRYGVLPIVLAYITSILIQDERMKHFLQIVSTWGATQLGFINNNNKGGNSMNQHTTFYVIAIFVMVMLLLMVAIVYYDVFPAAGQDIFAHVRAQEAQAQPPLFFVGSFQLTRAQVQGMTAQELQNFDLFLRLVRNLKPDEETARKIFATLLPRMEYEIAEDGR